MQTEHNKIKYLIQKAKSIENDIQEYQSIDVTHAYQKLQEKMKRSARRGVFLKYFQRVASVLFIPLLLSVCVLAIYLSYHLSSEEITYYTFKSAPGLVSQLELPDKSKVWLNSGSTLRYPSVFKENERKVYLSGEAYFDIEADKKNPFIVEMGNELKVKAYGTTFNINSYLEDSISETVLESGAVEMIIKNSFISLKPGEMATYDKADQRVSIKNISTDEKTAWRNGKLIFRNATIEEVTKVLSRRYNVDIILHPENATAYKFRASFSNETIDQILNYLKLAAPIEWSFSDINQKEDASYTRQQINLWLKNK